MNTGHNEPTGQASNRCARRGLIEHIWSLTGQNASKPISRPPDTIPGPGHNSRPEIPGQAPDRHSRTPDRASRAPDTGLHASVRRAVSNSFASRRREPASTVAVVDVPPWRRQSSSRSHTYERCRATSHAYRSRRMTYYRQPRDR